MKLTHGDDTGKQAKIKNIYKQLKLKPKNCCVDKIILLTSRLKCTILYFLVNHINLEAKTNSLHRENNDLPLVIIKEEIGSKTTLPCLI